MDIFESSKKTMFGVGVPGPLNEASDGHLPPTSKEEPQAPSVSLRPDVDPVKGRKGTVQLNRSFYMEQDIGTADTQYFEPTLLPDDELEAVQPEVEELPSDSNIMMVDGQVPHKVPPMKYLKRVSEVKAAMEDAEASQIDSFLDDFVDRHTTDTFSKAEAKREIVKIAPHDPDLEGRLLKRDMVFLSRSPAKGWINIGSGAGQTQREFTYDKVLVYDLDSEDFSFLAVPSDRDDTSLISLSACQRRVEGGQNGCIPVGAIRGVGDEQGLFTLNETVRTMSEGTRVLLNAFNEGGMGDLLLTYHTATDRFQVMKCLSDHLTDGEQRSIAKKCLHNEAALLSKLDGCPGIVQSLGFIVEDEKEYLITEYCDMTTYQLFERAIKEGKPNLYFKHALDGLTEAIKSMHDRKIADLDLKEDNVLWKVDEQNIPRCKKIDFGTALTYAASRNTNNLIFTPRTVEPELFVPYVYTQIFMRRPELVRVDYETQCDVYSLGRTLMGAVKHALETSAEISGEDPGKLFSATFDPRNYQQIVRPDLRVDYDPAKAVNYQLCMVPWLIAGHLHELKELKEVNGRLDVFHDEMFNILSRFTAPRPMRPFINNSRESIELEVIDGEDDIVFGGASTVNEPTPRMTGEYFTVKRKGRKLTLSSSIARDMIGIVDRVKKTHDNDELYLKITYKMNGDDTGKVSLEDKISHEDSKRFGQKHVKREGCEALEGLDIEYLDNLAYMEPEALIPFFGAHALAAYAPDEETRDYLLAAERIDYEQETNVYQLGRVLVHKMAEELDIPIFRGGNKSFARYIGKCLADMKSKRSPDELAAFEPVNTLYTEHSKDFEDIRRANAEQNKFDPDLINLAEKMTAFRMEGRISLDEARSWLESLAIGIAPKMTVETPVADATPEYVVSAEEVLPPGEEAVELLSEDDILEESPIEASASPFGNTPEVGYNPGEDTQIPITQGTMMRDYLPRPRSVPCPDDTDMPLEVELVPPAEGTQIPIDVASEVSDSAKTDHYVRNRGGSYALTGEELRRHAGAREELPVPDTLSPAEELAEALYVQPATASQISKIRKAKPGFDGSIIGLDEWRMKRGDKK